ncbi:hypothetical protein [Actinophytocola sp.]|uniref:hypothetical protein n=1 Tax=Actinophytocola sp. TaxID=1872138 RepID=UPI00389AD154
MGRVGGRRRGGGRHAAAERTAWPRRPQDLQRVFYSREEVHEYNEQWTRQATLVAAPGTGTNGHSGVNPGSAASWNIYPYTGWVGVVLSNSDDAPLQDILQREVRAVTGT